VSYLLDTNVVAVLRRQERHPRVAAWLRGQPPGSLYLSVVSLGEIARGIESMRHRDPVAADRLAIWQQSTVTLFADRLLDFTAKAAVLWGELSARLGHDGADLQIAATALERDLVVVTRNVRDFERTTVRLFDPFTLEA
jgi:predicted nucleic acid-binding protein